ncbi:MAG: hypothetical protein K0S07_395 [Chlamydiales bacterium]|nr:hypothetical protein [Chlamydiales bacterium]
MENIEIALFLDDVRGGDLESPHVGIADIRNGSLNYKKLIMSEIPEITFDKESYEEAFKAMEIKGIPLKADVR